MKGLAYISILLVSTLPGRSSVCAQVLLEQQVIGSAGISSSLSGNVAVDLTIGEAVIDTRTAGTLSLTQGFHQPLSKLELRFELELTNATCPGSVDGRARVFNIRGCTPPYTITWSNGAAGAEVGPLAPGAYSLTVASGGCERTVQFAIATNPEGDCRLRFYNAFSPNNDGVNDVWEIENIQLPEFAINRVQIFNRWGQEVWSGSGYNNQGVAWDGKGPDGTPLPHATYFYLANVAEVLYKGYIELTR